MTNYAQTIAVSATLSTTVSAPKGTVYGRVSVVWSLPAKVLMNWGLSPELGSVYVFQPFTRKNTLVVTAKFIAADCSNTQPTTANVTVSYPIGRGKRSTQTIPLAYDNTTNEWLGTWDTSVSSDGIVEWMAYGEGTLVAANQGRFALRANLANLATE